MSLPFLKSDMLDHFRSAKAAPEAKNEVKAKKDSRPPALTTIAGGAGGGVGAALAKTSKELAEAAVKARLAGLRPAPPPPKPAGLSISVPRFAKTMRERVRAAQYEKTKAMVGQIEQFELDQLIELAAKTRARYFSKLLEFGRANRPLSFAASEEVKGLREQHEEIERGLELLREALERGELEVEGVEPI
jgi:hypothetical protein